MVSAIVLALVVIMAVAATVTTYLDDGGDDILGLGDNSENALDCALGNPEDAKSECIDKEDSSFEEVNISIHAT